MPSLLGAHSRAYLPSATMSGCSKRCKLGFVKFAQTIFKLVTGTLSKGREPGLDPRLCLNVVWLAKVASALVWRLWPFWCAGVSEEGGGKWVAGIRGRWQPGLRL